MRIFLAYPFLFFLFFVMRKLKQRNERASPGVTEEASDSVGV